ncbi:TANFOR domain-containing protein [Chryseolinea serpens]|uniref:TANFOR domain-containing protein n=1 Tax=Chryseolinea serpens TaxID=947013 RepID=A0A1M5QRL5_9BACT|nr:hypothetical protein [Chryseolinea serpens]SHH16420.1 TANFOR domain-containing protein [Chryseolinea serpens]
MSIPVKVRARAVVLIVAVLWLVALATYCQAQNDVTVTVMVAPPYSTKIDDYEKHPERIIITLQSHRQSAVSLQLRGSIIGENGIEIHAARQYRSPRPIDLPAGMTLQLDAMAVRSLFDIDKVEVRGTSVAALREGNGLPEGTYRICARAYDYNQPEVPLSVDEPMGCSNAFRITNLEPPYLIRPYADEVVRSVAPQNVLFTWSFPAGAPPSTQFKLKIVEILTQGRNINDAMQSATTPPFFEQTVTGNAFLFGPAQPTLIAGRKYAFMVTAIDPFRSTVFRNEGRSEVSSFTFGEAPANKFPNLAAFKVMDAMGPLVCSCQEAVPGGGVDNSKAIVGSKVTVGKFEMTVLEATEQAGMLKGRGKINFPMINSKLIPILVEFADLQVNASNQAISGTVKAKVKSDVDFIPAVPAPNIQSIPFTSSDAQKLDEYFKANVKQLVSNINAAIDNAGFEMPLGLDKTIGGIGTVIAITGATFTPMQATFEAATVVNIPDGATKIALGAKSVCMDNAGLCGQGTLYLSSDFNIAPINMKLKGVAPMPVNPLDSGTYVVFDKDGFKKLRIQAEYAFPAGMLVKKSDMVSPVKATLTASAITWSNWMAKVDIDPFYLAGSTDFGFSLVGSGTYDHSSSSNPVGMPVIAAKPNISTPDWNGFYLPNLTVELPAIIKKASGGPPITTAVKDLIIDTQGLSGAVNATNVLAIGDGDLGGWYYSVDNIGVNFLNNSFVSGGMNGKLVLPISGSNAGNPKGQLDYTSTLSKPAGSLEFQFVIKPKNDLEVPMWYSQFTLANTSNILVTAGGGKDFYAAATLNGSMDIITNLSPLPNINFKAMEFQGLKLQTVAPYLSIETFNAGLASPNKSLGGFDIGLEQIKPVLSGTKAGIGFTMNVELCNIALMPKASFSFDLLGKLDFNGKRPDWKYDKVDPKAISLEGTVGPVNVKGDVAFFDGDKEFGSGIRGGLKAVMFSGFEADAQVLFGSKSFHYWYVDARFKLPPPGIAVGGPIPISIFGFGGGVFYNLSQKPVLNPKDFYSAGPPPLANTYVPTADRAGFKATIIMGVSDGSSFQASGTFEAIVNTSTMAPVSMSIDIDAAMICPLMQTDKAFVKGRGLIRYDFANDIFDAMVGVNVNLVDVIDGHGFVHLNIDARKSQWFFKVGEPSDRIRLSLVKFLNYDGYLMMGNHDIPGVPPPPQQVLDQIKGYSGNRTGDMGMGEGLAFGASMSYGPADLRFLIFYMRLGAGIGFDIALRKLSEGCDAAKEPGINGWYANGQLYMWAEFAFGLFVDEWFFTGNVAVAEVKAAALMTMGIPNPTWFDGWLHGEYNVLGGLISGHMNFHVEVGSRCVPEYSPFGGIPIISQISPVGNKISVLADPQTAFNYPVETEFVIPMLNDKGVQVNRTFRIDLQQFDVIKKSTGEVFCSKDINRTFRLSDGARLATIYTQAAFDELTSYTIKVKLQAFEIIGSTKKPCTFKGNLVIEERTIDFTTDKCPEDLNGAVLASYPINRQRYLLQKESTSGYIELTKPVGCLMSNPNYVLLASFTSYKGGVQTGTLEVPVASLGSYGLSFSIPTLPNDQLIEFKLIKRVKAPSVLAAAGAGGAGIQKLDGMKGTTLMSGNFTHETQNKYLGSYNFMDVHSSALTGVQLSMKKVPDVTIYKYYFKTSKYNTLAEKLSHSEVSSTARKDAFGILELYAAEYGMSEGFDVFDMRGFTYIFAGTETDNYYKIGPLVVVSEAKPRNRWSEEHTRHAFYEPWAKVYYGGYTEELGPRYIRSFGTPFEEIAFFEPASRPIDFSVGSVDPALTNAEIHEQVVSQYIKTYANEAASTSVVTKMIMLK